MHFKVTLSLVKKYIPVIKKFYIYLYFTLLKNCHFGARPLLHVVYVNPILIFPMFGIVFHGIPFFIRK